MGRGVTLANFVAANIYAYVAGLLSDSLAIDKTRVVVTKVTKLSAGVVATISKVLLESFSLKVDNVYVVTVVLSGFETLVSGQTAESTLSTYLNGAFAVDLSTQLQLTVTGIGSVQTGTILAETDSMYTCKLNQHMTFSWKNYVKDNMVKVTIMGDSNEVSPASFLPSFLLIDFSIHCLTNLSITQATFSSIYQFTFCLSLYFSTFCRSIYLFTNFLLFN